MKVVFMLAIPIMVPGEPIIIVRRWRWDPPFCALWTNRDGETDCCMTECCILSLGAGKTLHKTVGYWLKEFVVSGYRQKCPIDSTYSKRELCMCYAVVFTHFMAASLMLLLNPSLAIAVEIDFDREVLPILEDRCWHCHGEDEVESGLRLDRRATMLKGGDSGLAAVVPGQVADSYLAGGCEASRSRDGDAT